MELEIAVAALKKGRSDGVDYIPAEVDYIPAELVLAGGEAIIDVLTETCNKVWRTGGKIAYPVDSVADYYTT